MTKDALKKHIDLYKNTEESIFNLDKEYGINIWDSNKPNFYNNFNYLIHNLLVDIFGSTKTDIIEDYIWETTNITFDELWDIIEKDETNSK